MQAISSTLMIRTTRLLTFQTLILDSGHNNRYLGVPRFHTNTIQLSESYKLDNLQQDDRNRADPVTLLRGIYSETTNAQFYSNKKTTFCEKQTITISVYYLERLTFFMANSIKCKAYIWLASAYKSAEYVPTLRPTKLLNHQNSCLFSAIGRIFIRVEDTQLHAIRVLGHFLRVEFP